MKKLTKILTRTLEVLTKIIYVACIIVMSPIVLIVNLFHGASLKESFEGIGYALSIATSSKEWEF